MLNQRALVGGDRRHFGMMVVYRDEVKMKNRTSYMLACIALGCLTLSSCSQMNNTQSQADRGPAGIHELESLYDLATAPQSHDVRKPVRDERARAMRLLAEKTQAFLATTASWDSEARLTSISEPQRDCARKDIRSFRQALDGLETAARSTDLSRVRSEYSEVLGIYRHLREHIGENNS
jgi:hypothetical protein